MGTLFSGMNPSDNVTNNRIFPVRHFRNLHDGIDISTTRLDLWNPDRYKENFQYPAKEPAKDF